MKTHGHATRAQRTPTYQIWKAMKDRCVNPRNPRFARYGGRGVTICESWLHSFENLLADMGERPEGKSLDRIDNDLGYEPGNCRWASSSQQVRNTARTRMIAFNGETLCLRDWERKLGLGYGTLWRRLAKGETAPHAMRAVK